MSSLHDRFHCPVPLLFWHDSWLLIQIWPENRADHMVQRLALTRQECLAVKLIASTVVAHEEMEQFQETSEDMV